MSKVLGKDVFEAGSKLASTGKVGEPMHLGSGISVYAVRDGKSSRTVLKREYPDGG